MAGRAHQMVQSRLLHLARNQRRVEPGHIHSQEKSGMKILDTELKDASHTPKKCDAPTVAQAPCEPEVQYPRLENYNAPIPGLDDLEVGKKYVVIAVAECTRKEEVKDGKVTGCLEIHNIGFKPYKKKS